MKLATSHYKGKKMDTTTQTVPDQNMGIRELLNRHTRGVPLGVNSRKGEYFDTEIVRYDDLTDMLEHKQDLKKQERELNARIKQQKASEKAEKENLSTNQSVENTNTQKKTTPSE